MFPKRFLVISVGLVCLSHYPSTAGAQVFITSWGTYGSGSGQFRTPQGVAVGGSGDVYIVDGDNLRVQVFSSGGSFLRMWPAVGANIAVDASDNVYVGAFQNMIRKFTRTGTLLTEWDTGSLFFSLAVDGSGSVYVADYTNNRVKVFTDSGVYLREWGSPGSGPGQFDRPDGLAIDAAGNAYVADKFNRRIQKFANDGTFLAQWGGYGTGDGQFAGPVRVAIGPQGDVYVVDNLNRRVQAFTAEGVFITKWGTEGTGTGQFDNPIGIAVDGNGDIYVADTNNSRIQKFAPGVPTPVQALTWGNVKVRYRGERAGQFVSQGR